MKKTTIWGFVALGLAIIAAATLIYLSCCRSGDEQFRETPQAPLANETDLAKEPGEVANVNSEGQEWRIPETIEFSVSSGEERGIKFWSGKIDPLKVFPGDTQNMRIVVSSNRAIASVEASIETDSGRQLVNLSQVGSEEENDIVKEVWEGSWLVNDTSVRDYETIFTATDAAGNTKDLTLAWSDPCLVEGDKELPYSGNRAIVESCSISSTYGLDSGNLTIPAGVQVTVVGASGSTATMAFNPGNSLTLQSGAVLTIGNDAQMKKAYLWVKDADGDGYTTALLSDRTFSSSPTTPPLSGYRRQAEMYNDYLEGNTLAVDCNDSDPSIPEPSTQWCDPYLYCSPYPYSATDGCGQARADACSEVSSCNYVGELCNCWTGKASRKRMLGGCGEDGLCRYENVDGYPRMDESQCPDALSYTWKPCELTAE